MPETSLNVKYFVPTSRETKFIHINPDMLIIQLASLIRADNQETLGGVTLEIYQAEEEWFNKDPEDLYADLSARKATNKLKFLPYAKTVRSFLNGTPKTFCVIVFKYTSQPRTELSKKPRNHATSVIYNGRPLEHSQPPIAIWHPVFAKFRRLISVPAESRRFTPEQLDRATCFIMASSEIYQDETARHNKLDRYPPFSWLNCFMQGYEFVNGTQLKLDGGVCTPIRLLDRTLVRPYSMFVEVRSEIGTGGTDPLMQAQHAWKTLYSSDRFTPIHRVSSCPAFLVAIAGPYIAISGAIITDQFISEPLLDYTLLGPQFSSSNEGRLSAGIRKVAHVVDTLEQCVHDLEDHYKDIPNRLKDPVVRCPKWSPHFRQFTTTDGKSIILEYTDRLSKEISRKAVFTASAKDTSGSVSTVVVKFTPTYNPDAHTLLAQEGLAPKLWFCERIPDVGGLYVVIMDYVHENKTCDDLDRTETLRDNYPGAIHSLRRAIRLLHADNFVFGDLREPNVLIRGSGLDASVMLVDFDWCGREGEVRYPCEINLDKEMKWHKDVCRDGYMRKEHDEWMFEVLTGERFEEPV